MPNISPDRHTTSDKYDYHRVQQIIPENSKYYLHNNFRASTPQHDRYQSMYYNGNYNMNQSIHPSDPRHYRMAQSAVQSNRNSPQRFGSHQQPYAAYQASAYHDYHQRQLHRQQQAHQQAQEQQHGLATVIQGVPSTFARPFHSPNSKIYSRQQIHEQQMRQRTQPTQAIQATQARHRTQRATTQPPPPASMPDGNEQAQFIEAQRQREMRNEIELSNHWRNDKNASLANIALWMLLLLVHLWLLVYVYLSNIHYITYYDNNNNNMNGNDENREREANYSIHDILYGIFGILYFMRIVAHWVYFETRYPTLVDDIICNNLIWFGILYFMLSYFNYSNIYYEKYHVSKQYDSMKDAFHFDSDFDDISFYSKGQQAWIDQEYQPPLFEQFYKGINYYAKAIAGLLCYDVFSDTTSTFLLQVFSAALYFAGITIATVSEIQRYQFKKMNPDSLYTRGLFEEFNCRHVNHFGELLLFFGWSMYSGCILNVAVPILIYINLTGTQLPHLEYYLYLRYNNIRQNYKFTHWKQRTNLLFPKISSNH